jgi:hypothetical protein
LHKRREVSKVLQDLLAEILQEVTIRAVEVKSLHCQIRGQKEAKPILKALYSRHGKIERLITLFNEQLQCLPQDTWQQVVQPLRIESFQPDTGEEDMDGAVETSHFSTLIQVDVLSCLAAGDAIGPLDPQDGRVAMYKRITGEDPWFAWGLSDLVHQAIQYWNRIARAKEEIEMLKHEVQRLGCWSLRRVAGVLKLLGTDPPE